MAWNVLALEKFKGKIVHIVCTKFDEESQQSSEYLEVGKLIDVNEDTQTITIKSKNKTKQIFGDIILDAW